MAWGWRHFLLLFLWTTLSHGQTPEQTQWIRYFGKLGYEPSRSEEILSKVNAWKNMADDFHHPRLKKGVLERLFGAQISWIKEFNLEQQTKAYNALNQLDFRASTLDGFVKSMLAWSLWELVYGAQSPNARRDQYGVVARQMVQRSNQFHMYFYESLLKVVKPRSPEQRFDRNRKLVPAVNFINLNVTVPHLNILTGQTFSLTGKEWVEQTYLERGSMIESFVLRGGSSDSRYMVLLDYFAQNFRYQDPNYKKSQESPSPRQEVLFQGHLNPILDKCIACHATPNSDMRVTLKTYKLTTYDSLIQAMRTGGMETFRKEILPMMKKTKEQIIFNADEIAAIEEVYRDIPPDKRTRVALYPVAEPKSAEESRLPSYTRRASALRNNIVHAAITRCLICHKDPETRGTENMNTFSTLRAAMRKISPERMEEMIQRANKYKATAYIVDRENVNGVDLPLKSALIQFARLPRD